MSIFDTYLESIDNEDKRIRKESLSRAIKKARQIVKESRSNDENKLANEIEQMIKVNFPSLKKDDINKIIFEVLPPGDIKERFDESEYSRFIDSKGEKLFVGDKVAVNFNGRKFSSVIVSTSGDQIELKGGTLVSGEMLTKKIKKG